MAKEYFIGDFLKRIKRPVELVANSSYKLVTIKLFHKGVVLRELKRGGEIKSGMHLVKKGDFILSGIDARNGAFGIVPDELDNAIVTNDFWYFEIDEQIISKKLFLELTATNWFDDICKRGSEGTTQRIRLQKDKFFNQKVLLPDKNEQETMLDLLLQFKSKKTELISEINNQEGYLKQLRLSILQDAVKGKLVSQHGKDEPATELLKRIKWEIKKEKPLPPIIEEEIQFEIPESWVWCRIGEIAQHNSGKTLDKGRNKGALRDCITTSNLYWGYFEIEKLKQIKIETGELERCTARKGDLLICEGGEAGRSAIWDFDYEICFQNHIHRVRPYGKINSNFIYWYFMYLYLSGTINKYRKGMGINNLSGKALSLIVFPLPPLAEQNRIVEKVNELMELCASLEKEIAHSKQEADYLLNAILRETFQQKKPKDYSLTETPISIAAEE